MALMGCYYTVKVMDTLTRRETFVDDIAFH